MKKYDTKHIRNLALVGHSGSGKTSLTEALLYKTGVTNRLGHVESGNTVSDFDKEEIARGVSIGLSVVPVEWKDVKINLLDAPGYFDFEGQVLAALRASEAALMVIDASAGIEVGTQKYWDYTEEIQMPRMILLNKLEKENVDFNVRVSELHQRFGSKVVPLTLTLGMGETFEGLIDVIDKKAYKYDGFNAVEVEIPEIRIAEVEAAYDEIVEVVAMADDKLMDKFFEGEAFTFEEIKEGMTTAMLNGSAVPLIAGSTATGAGMDLLMDVAKQYMPSPDDERAHLGFRPVEGENRKVSVDEPTSAVVFKTIADPFVGKISIFKVASGSVKKGDDFYNLTKNLSEKPGGLFYVRGKQQIETSEVVAGDIGALSKLEATQTGDTFGDQKKPIVYKPIKYPMPTLTYAIEADSKNDEDKIGTALTRLQEEDPSWVYGRNAETKQQTIGGQGNVQLEVVLNKLKSNFGVSAHAVPLRIAYRETIKGKSDVQGRHKKQTGGAGQFGDVYVRFEPIEGEFEFVEEVFGGSVPKNYFPAVEKGLREALDKGPLAGYPVTGIKATLYDGSYHPVDSNEMAFKLASQIAFRKGVEEAKPVLLEPVMSVVITIPGDYLGDVMGDMNKRRGRILGMEQIGDKQIVNAEAPYGELVEYAIDLRSMTQGRGAFTMEFLNYEEVPSNIAEKIIKEAQEEN